MPQTMTSVLVLIASPGDTADERGAVSLELNDWNVRTGRRQGVALLPWLYERHSIPVMGNRPQAIINQQAVDRADVVVAFFDSRLGTSTGVDVSGTAEEINKAVGAGKSVHVYFSEEDIPRGADLTQIEALRAFKADLESKGLLGSYGDPRDLAGQVVRALEADIESHGWDDETHAVRTAPGDGVDLRWRHLHERELSGADSRGRPKYRTTHNDLVVTNDSDVIAEGLTYSVEPVGGNLSFHLDYDAQPVDIRAHSELGWLFIPGGSMRDTARSIRVKANWQESGQPKAGEWTVVVRGG